ncbi:MAG: diguanylate cyclase [Defluviitaleaceae bacterium]|nr:diguanylate cyclase [Defluviitaleaceae bacterium]MCL2275233.1 diguanylate cyclase [Defluviitaleaceae bacterium]
MAATNSVLIIDDEVMHLRALVDMLRDEYTVYAERDGTHSLESALKLKPDLILLDILMPGTNGFDEIKRLKNDEHTKNIPIIFLTGLNAPEDEVRGFLHGAVDYITKPFNAHAVKMRVQHQIQIVNLLREVRHNSVTDTLTNIGNRRYFNDLLNQEWERAKRQQSPIGLLILDIDYFKTFNDRYGHLNGDVVLKTVAHIISAQTVRASDRVARWGGEEFAVILPNTAIAGAKKVANAILAAIKSTNIVLNDNQTIRVSASIGVHCYIPERDGVYSELEFIADADEALLLAKKKGRDCICTFEEIEK